MGLINWSRNQADDIIEGARRWAKRLDERGVTRAPSPPSSRNHKKRHSVNRERSYEQRAKAARAKRTAAADAERRARYREVTRIYYAGEVDDLSGLPR